MTMIDHRVRERAYFIWESEGRVSGRAHAHWIQAETELAATDIIGAAIVEVEALPAVAVTAPVAKAPARAAAKAKAPTARKKAAAAKAPARKSGRKGQDQGIALH